MVQLSAQDQQAIEYRLYDTAARGVEYGRKFGYCKVGGHYGILYLQVFVIGRADLLTGAGWQYIDHHAVLLCFILCIFLVLLFRIVGLFELFGQHAFTAADQLRFIAVFT